MNHVTRQMRYFAGCLIAHEAGGATVTTPPTAVPVVKKLQPHLATLMGTTGFRVLLTRALTLAAGEVPWLSRVEVHADGTLAHFEKLPAASCDDEIAEGSVVLIARLLGLLVSFIGEILTLQLVREVWPELPEDDYFTQGDDHEQEH